MPSRSRPFIALMLVSLLGGCLALPQVGFMLGRIALSSMGVENVRIGNYHFSPGLEDIDEDMGPVEKLGVVKIGMKLMEVLCRDGG